MRPYRRLNLCVTSVHLVHARGQGRACAPEDEVVVVAHQAECVQAPAEAAHRVEHEAEEVPSIVLIPVDSAAVDPPSCDVVYAVGEKRSGDSGHLTTLLPCERPHPCGRRVAGWSHLTRLRGTVQGQSLFVRRGIGGERQSRAVFTGDGAPG